MSYTRIQRAQFQATCSYIDREGWASSITIEDCNYSQVQDLLKKRAYTLRGLKQVAVVVYKRQTLQEPWYFYAHRDFSAKRVIRVETV